MIDCVIHAQRWYNPGLRQWVWYVEVHLYADGGRVSVTGRTGGWPIWEGIERAIKSAYEVMHFQVHALGFGGTCLCPKCQTEAAPDDDPAGATNVA